LATLIQGNNIGGVWARLVHELIRRGAHVAPRGQETRELMNVTLEVTDGLNNILLSEIRKLNYRFMVAEWLWIQAGMNDVKSLTQYNSVMKNFSDDGEILNGAYGPRLYPQWEYIIEALRNDSSRQAVATIWTANPTVSKDIPCTISLQWLVRERKLHCTINMRSSDVWLGLPYDFFSFSQLTNVLCGKMGLEMGSITMNLASSHLYDVNFGDASAAMYACCEHLRSPQLCSHHRIPTKSVLQRMISQERTEAIRALWPWGEYSRALLTNSQTALEVLSGLDPS
jgi:thymidylate synthase